MLEEERTFAVSPEFVRPDLVNAHRGLATLVPGQRLSLRAAYYDTADGAFHRGAAAPRRSFGDRTRAPPLAGRGCRDGGRACGRRRHGAPRTPDAVHQLRVTCLRLHGEPRTFAPVIERKWADQLCFELNLLASSCGPARDLELLRIPLRGLADGDPEFPIDCEQLERVDALSGEQEAVALQQARGALSDKRYVALLDMLVDGAQSPRTTPAHPPRHPPGVSPRLA